MEKEKALGVDIRITSNLVKNYVDKTLQEKLKESLTGIEGMILGYIFHNQGSEITAKAVMENGRAAKATVSQSLSGLVKKGYIVMTPSKEDKRKKVIALTDKGMAVEAEFKEIFKDISAKVEKGISQEEIQNFRQVLKKMRDNIGE
jgi:MarR family transcriptional regulator, repressor for mepA